MSVLTVSLVPPLRQRPTAALHRCRYWHSGEDARPKTQEKRLQRCVAATFVSIPWDQRKIHSTIAHSTVPISLGSCPSVNGCVRIAKRTGLREGHTLVGHYMSDQPMVCESPLRFRWNLAHVQIMHKNKSVQIFRDVGQAVSEIWPSKKWKKGRFLRQDPSVKCK